MAFEVMVDPETLREQVKEKYREVAMNPRGSFHFHTGRPSIPSAVQGERGTPGSSTSLFMRFLP
jgi:hypothetical protein